MSAEPTNTPNDPTPKWWIESMTMWGAAITAIAAYVPYIAFAMGWPITEEMVLLFGQAVTTAMQHAGIAVGLALTIIGRFRAKTRLVQGEVRFKL